ncbi:Flap-structured DNA-binding and RNA-binding protein [Rhizopus stolonifer]|uniref:Flap-structured DNA-binding and RNA-binding protein n=1 Tax=Rhizopus stolonifer TaxID=4846 RepID=A0A367JNS8_RHIST|nr:Flap-structured DNA-binding and RNA-binding protein [Rhizopus stolonifer]
MSTQSSFQRNSVHERFSSLLNPEGYPSSSGPTSSTSLNLSPDIPLGYNTPFRNLSQDTLRHQRPVSEIIKHDSFISPEAEVLDKWYQDLQEYESSLESMASASLDPKYKEEVQHVDQWFRYLNEAERTATIYTLLQHSTQVQIRFFMAVLQQMDKKDPLAALLSPAHPEKDMQAQLAGAFKKAEMEASQKLLSVLPYQTGQVTSRPNAGSIGRRNPIDRHSFALGDTEEYDRLFSSDYLRNSLHEQQRFTHTFDPMHGRPKSVAEDDLSSIFDWSYGQPNLHPRPGSVGANRPKSADISNWSFGLTSSKSAHDKDHLSSPWTGMSPSFNEQTIHNDVDQQLSMLNNWSLNNTRPGMLNDDTKGFRRRTMNRTSIPGTVPETDERALKQVMQSPPHTNIVLSMYDDNQPVSSTLLTHTMPHYHPIQSPHTSRPTSRSTSPVPSQSNSMINIKANYGHFLNPHDTDNGYVSDHSETSQSGKSKKKTANRHGNTNGKEKKTMDGVDMKLLEDVPTWLRSLRLHKYNPIFETMKWQDMLKMDDEALLKQGVAALGARRKLLKVFDQVKAHCEENNIAY